MRLLLDGGAGGLVGLEPSVVVPVSQIFPPNLSILGLQVLLEARPVGVGEDAVGQVVLGELGVDEAYLKNLLNCSFFRTINHYLGLDRCCGGQSNQLGTERSEF